MYIVQNNNIICPRPLADICNLVKAVPSQTECNSVQGVSENQTVDFSFKYNISQIKAFFMERGTAYEITKEDYTEPTGLMGNTRYITLYSM